MGTMVPRSIRAITSSTTDNAALPTTRRHHSSTAAAASCSTVLDTALQKALFRRLACRSVLGRVIFLASFNLLQPLAQGQHHADQHGAAHHAVDQQEQHGGKGLAVPEEFHGGENGADYQRQDVEQDEQGRRDAEGILEGLSADGMVTLKSDDGDYTFPVKAAGYVKLCDDEDLF